MLSWLLLVHLDEVFHIAKLKHWLYKSSYLWYFILYILYTLVHSLGMIKFLSFFPFKQGLFWLCADCYHPCLLIAGAQSLQSCPALCDPMDSSPADSLSMGFSRQEYWSGLHALFQGIFLTQESNLRLLHCRWVLYPLSHLGSPPYKLGTSSKASMKMLFGSNFKHTILYTV